MSAHFVRKNSNVNLVHEFEEESELPVTTVQDCSHELWLRGLGDHGTEEEPILWEDLGEEDWLAIQHAYLKDVIMGLAGVHQHDMYRKEADVIAEAAILERHGLGNNA